MSAVFETYSRVQKNLELVDILNVDISDILNVSFTTSETERDYY